MEQKRTNSFIKKVLSTFTTNKDSLSEILNSKEKFMIELFDRTNPNLGELDQQQIFSLRW